MPELEKWPTGRLLTTAARLVENAWNERLVQIGLTHAGFTVLGVLQARGPLTQITLAHTVRVQAQTMGKTVERLETAGYVVRTRSAQDRRIQVVSISPAGIEALAAAKDLETNMVHDGTLASAALRGHLRKIIDALTAHRR